MFMNPPKVVIGSGYGDEGKGLITDYLTSRYSADMVVRFNGGAQAGHTVTTPSGERHIFSHIGAGTFAGASTFLSKYFIVNPFIFFKELDEFRYLLRSMPSIYIDTNALVTTPYDMLINQLVEKQRGDYRHGSCGLGFGETIERSLSSNQLPTNYYITAKLIEEPDLLKKMLEKIRDEYFPKRCQALGIDPYLGKDVIDNKNIITNFIDDAQEMIKYCELSDAGIMFDAHQLVFEGAQGLLLDQDYGIFPHVTRSNTGLTNVASIISDLVTESEVDVYYTTRCYTTRHGAGPLNNELKTPPYEGVYDTTNIPNKYQGSLRFAYLDIDAIEKAIKHDMNNSSVKKILTVKPHLAVTCLDQVDNEIKAYKNGRLQTIRGDAYSDVADVLNSMIGLDGELIKSFGETRSTITHITKT